MHRQKYPSCCPHSFPVQLTLLKAAHTAETGGPALALVAHAHLQAWAEPLQPWPGAWQKRSLSACPRPPCTSQPVSDMDFWASKARRRDEWSLLDTSSSTWAQKNPCALCPADQARTSTSSMSLSPSRSLGAASQVRMHGLQATRGRLQ